MDRRRGRVARVFVGLLLSRSAAAQERAPEVPDNPYDAPVQPGEPAAGTSARPAHFVAPVPLTRPHPRYPTDGDGHRVEVELLLTVDAHGIVTAIESLGHIPTSSPNSFDAAAVAAVRPLRFRPAVRDGVATPVRVRYHMAIVPPLVTMVDDDVAGTRPPEVGEFDDDEEGTTASEAPPSRVPEASVVVRGDAQRGRSATQLEIPIGTLGQVPRVTGSEVLSLAPGVMVTNDSTDGEADEVYLRGFSGDNGHDIEFSVDGMPLNEESNPHTHGQADLLFIIPEVVERLDVTEGLADPRQGNFALAGSIDYRLGVPHRGLMVRASYGTSGFGRVVGVYGPPHTNDQTFVAVDLAHSDGFGPRRNYDRAGAIGQVQTELGGGLTLRILGGAYVSQWAAPSALRQDDVSAGRVGFYGSYPSAGFQGGSSSRAYATAILEYRHELERARVQAFGGLRGNTISQNDTGYYENPDTGDLGIQRYNGGTVGGRGFYAHGFRLGGHVQEAEVGFLVRHDVYSLGEQALDASTGQPLSPPDTGDNSADVRVTNLALYGDAVVRPASWLALRAGLRFDALALDATLTTADPMTGQPSLAPRSAFVGHLGPKATVEFDLGRGLSILASYGTGFRSPDARSLPASGPLPIALAQSEEIGLRYVSPGRAPWSATLAAFHVGVDNDLAFDPTVGDTVLVGPTDRWGGVAWVRAHPVRWLDVSASVAGTYAVVQQASLSGEVLPAGHPIPYLPPVVARLDAAVQHPLGTWRTWAVIARAALGVGVRGPTPMINLPATDPVVLVDAMAGIRVGPVGFDLNGRNLLDLKWHSSEFEYASNFAPGTPASMTPVLHFTSGAPLAVFGTVSLYL